jgi:hypothetical protein
MMLFLPLETWLRLVGWLVIGMVILVGYGFRHSAMGRKQWLQGNGSSLEDDGAYYRSESYRRRLAFSLWFCLIASLAALGVSGWLYLRWHAGTLGGIISDINPLIVLIVAGGINAFLLLMLATNLREWLIRRAT